MNSPGNLLISLVLSPWSLGLKQYIRGLNPLNNILPRGSRILRLYPASGSDAVLLLAWSYWLLDGCCKKNRSVPEDVLAVLDCTACRAIVFASGSSVIPSYGPESMGYGQMLINGEEQLRIQIAPGDSGSIDIRNASCFVPWIFPEGDGLYYRAREEESGENENRKSVILPGYLIDEALKFADAVFGNRYDEL